MLALLPVAVPLGNYPSIGIIDLWLAVKESLLDYSRSVQNSLTALAVAVSKAHYSSYLPKLEWCIAAPSS